MRNSTTRSSTGPVQRRYTSKAAVILRATVFSAWSSSKPAAHRQALDCCSIHLEGLLGTEGYADEYSISAVVGGRAAMHTPALRSKGERVERQRGCSSCPNGRTISTSDMSASFFCFALTEPLHSSSQVIVDRRKVLWFPMWRTSSKGAMAILLVCGGECSR